MARQLKDRELIAELNKQIIRKQKYIIELENGLTEEGTTKSKALERVSELTIIITKLEIDNKQLKIDREHTIEAAKKHEQMVGLFMRWEKPRLERENDLLTKILKEAMELIRELRDIIKMNTDDIKLKEDKILELANKLKLRDEQIRRMFDCCGGEKCVGTESCMKEVKDISIIKPYEMTECPGCKFALVSLDGVGPIYKVKCPDCGWSGEVIKTDILTSQWIPKCPVCNLVLILGECPKCKYDWNGELNPPKVDYTKECKDCIFINTKDCWPIIDDEGTCRTFKDKDNDKYTKCTLCKGEGHRPVMCTCEVCHGTGKKVK